MENKQMKCIKGESCLYCGSTYCRFVDELDQLKEQLEAYKMEAEEGKEINAELEAENEELKEQIKKHNDDMFKNPPEKRIYCKGCALPYISKKLKQTLTEIKEIAEAYGYWTPVGGYKQILQKISECEVENE